MDHLGSSQPSIVRSTAWRISAMLPLAWLVSQTCAQTPEPNRSLNIDLRRADTTRSENRVDVLASQGLALATPLDVAYYWRGRSRFRRGKIRDAWDDFNQYIERAPDAQSRLWERGIVAFYVGAYDAGAKQFTAYQRYDSHDVENAIWHYLCRSRIVGAPAAQRDLLPIRNDNRRPMMELHALYAGRRTAQQVFAAAEQGPQPLQNRQQFYAHLYVGLHHASWGRNVLAEKHLRAAAEDFPIDHFMWDVARVHVLSASAEGNPASAGRPLRADGSPNPTATGEDDES